MEPAVILTEEAAADAGLSDPGPLTFAGAFPGVYVVGEPIAITELGFSDVADVHAAIEDSGVPLEVVEIPDGEGRVERANHGLSMSQAREARVEAVVEEAGGIRTHADADAVAEELGIVWPEGRRIRLDEKRTAIDAVKAGTPAADAVATIGEEAVTDAG